MWCVFITRDGAYCKFLALSEVEEHLTVQENLTKSPVTLYGAFVHEPAETRFTDLINSVTF